MDSPPQESPFPAVFVIPECLNLGTGMEPCALLPLDLWRKGIDGNQGIHGVRMNLVSNPRGLEKPGAVSALPQEMEKEIKSLFRGGNQDEVLSEAFRLTITRKDIQTLNNLNWLNDEVQTQKFPFSTRFQQLRKDKWTGWVLGGDLWVGIPPWSDKSMGKLRKIKMV